MLDQEVVEEAGAVGFEESAVAHLDGTLVYKSGEHSKLPELDTLIDLFIRVNLSDLFMQIQVCKVLHFLVLGVAREIVRV